MKKLSGEDISDNLIYLDTVALEVMKVFIAQRNPTSIQDSVQVSRIAYRQALIMLQTRESIEQLAIQSAVMDENEYDKWKTEAPEEEPVNECKQCGEKCQGEFCSEDCKDAWLED